MAEFALSAESEYLNVTALDRGVVIRTLFLILIENFIQQEGGADTWLTTDTGFIRFRSEAPMADIARECAVWVEKRN